MVQRAARRAGANRIGWFAVVAVLLTVTVGWMHTVAVAPLPAGRHSVHQTQERVAMAGPASEPMLIARGCAKVGGHIAISRPGSDHDGDLQGGHPGGHNGGYDGHGQSMCQAPGLGGNALSSAPSLLPSSTVPATAIAALLATTTADAAGGSGCGPPSLTMLSISRT